MLNEVDTWLWLIVQEWFLSFIWFLHHQCKTGDIKELYITVTENTLISTRSVDIWASVEHLDIWFPQLKVHKSDLEFLV